MTIEEHKLLAFMFAEQAIATQSILDILDSHNLTEPDDPKAFKAAMRMHAEKRRAIVARVADLYRDTAQAVGVGDLSALSSD